MLEGKKNLTAKKSDDRQLPSTTPSKTSSTAVHSLSKSANASCALVFPKSSVSLFFVFPCKSAVGLFISFGSVRSTSETFVQSGSRSRFLTSVLFVMTSPSPQSESVRLSRPFTVLFLFSTFHEVPSWGFLGGWARKPNGPNQGDWQGSQNSKAQTKLETAYSRKIRGAGWRLSQKV